MPTFTTVALERLLEPTVRDSSPCTSKLVLESNKSEEAAAVIVKRERERTPHIYISPPLYTTPKPNPILESYPTSVSPSPYVVNRKRREVPHNHLGGFHLKGKSQEEVGVLDSAAAGGHGCHDPMNQTEDVSMAVPPLKEEGRDVGLLDIEIVEENDQGGLVKEDVLEKDEAGLDEFADPCDSLSVASSCDTDDRSSLQRSIWKHTPLSNQSMYYDATEEFLSDGSSSIPSPFSLNVEAELRAARLNLFEEFERRKKAEEALACMHNQWQKIVTNVSQVGLSFPVTTDAGCMQFEIDSAEKFCQEILIARFVSEAIGRGQARAEAEAAAEAVIDSKNQEMARLQDKLQYYEAVNHEMSQRNQQVIELSRRQRRSQMKRKKWIWGCIGLSISLGATLLAYSYLPQSCKELPAASNDDSDLSSNVP